MTDGTKESLTHTIQMEAPSRSKMRSNVSADDITTRAPPLEIQINSEVTVVNGDRSSLTWKRYKLIDINHRTGMCVVEGISDSRQRNFPRSVVKPKDWIDKIKLLFRAISCIDDEKQQQHKPTHPQQQQHHNYVEYHNFFNAIQLFGAEYDHEHALKIFKALDVRANGLLTFSQFINWMYGLGRTPDKGRLLTTVECITGLRKWRNALTYYVMATTDNETIEAGPKQCIWSTAKYDKEKSSAHSVHLVTMSTDDNHESDIFIVSKNLESFRQQFANKLLNERDNLVEVYSPSNEDERECSIVVMGPGEIGKTALISKFVRGVFVHDYDPTIQDHSRKQILVDGKPALLDILDTAGQDEFASMRYDWLKDSIDILLICFSRADHESFIRAEELILIAKRLLKQQKAPRIVPILLVATKQDKSEKECQVTLDDIEDLRQRHLGEKFIRYEECCALMDEGVQDVFETAVMMWREWKSDQSGIRIKYPTLREVQIRQRQGTYVQNIAQGGMVRGAATCASCWGFFCPGMSAVLEADEFAKNKVLNIASVPKDKFGDELAEPSYSKQHFFVQRELSFRRLFYCFIAAVFFPLLITLQTISFVFYCGGCTCCHACLQEGVDYTDPGTALLHDFFAPIVGRDPRESAKNNDARKWFLSQTCGQKIMRCFLTIVVDVLFFFAFWNAITMGLEWFSLDLDKEDALSVLETLGPGQLWAGMWVILGIYMSLDIHVRPEPPSMQYLRPYVMYLCPDESIRTTAYVFLRGFSKSTLSIFRLEATTERILTALFISTVWILVPGIVRVWGQADGGGKFFPDGLLREAVWSMFVSFCFVFLLVLGLQMQLMSGLVKYIEWMNAITSMLDRKVSEQNKSHYINLVRHNNTLSWIEMRTYLYTKGLIIFSRQEIFVFYVIFVQCVTSIYILTRLMSGTSLDNTYGSPSFVGVLLMWTAITWSLIRILRITRRVERLQSKQIALLAAQKFQIYFKRITWHPSKDEMEQQNENELSEGNELYDPDWADIDPRNLPPMIDPVEESDTETHTDIVSGDAEEAKETEPFLTGLSSSDDNQLNPLSTDLIPQTSQSLQLSRKPTRLRVERTTAANYGSGDMPQNETMFSAEYLDQSEKFVQAVINICEAQDIIPRVFNIKIQVAVGLSVLCTSFAVVPYAVRLAFGNDCEAWSN